jgi:uncharacterized protein
MTMSEDVRRDLEAVIRGLVDHPEVVEVREARGGRRPLLEARVHDDDMGAVIGRGGRTAEALRTLLEIRGESQGHSYDLKIRESEER